MVPTGAMPRCLKDTLEQRGGMKGWSGRGEKGLEGGEESRNRGRTEMRKGRMIGRKRETKNQRWDEKGTQGVRKEASVEDERDAQNTKLR